MNTNTINTNSLFAQMELQVKQMKQLLKRTSDPISRAKLQKELAIQENILEQLKSGQFGMTSR